MPALVALLEEDDTWLRRATAHLVAWFPRWAPRSLPVLRERLVAELDPDTKATMLVALGLLAGAREQTDNAPRLTDQLGDADAVVRWAAATALVRLFPQAPPEPAVQELLGWPTGQAGVDRDPQILFPDPETYALLVLGDLPVLGERAVGAILDRLPAQSGQAAISTMWNLTFLAFEQDQSGDQAAFVERPPLQQRVLRALVEMPALWRVENENPLPPILPLLTHWAPGQETASLDEVQDQLRAYVDA